MANNLTGDFEAVLQVGVRQINGLLATLHQNGASDDAPLELLHSATLRVGDPRKRFPDVTDFGDWVLEYRRTHSAVRPGDLPEHLTTTAPPGAAGRMKEVFSRFGVPEEAEIPPDVVRGTVSMQLSSPTLSLPAGSTSEVTVHVWVRAHYTPDPGTTDLPQPVHGEVQATFDVRLQPFQGDRQRLLIQPSAQDSKIQFLAAPGSGLSAAAAAAISTQVRKAVRESFTQLPVDLPEGFAFNQFKALGSGPGQALAAPIRLSGSGLPTGNIQSVTDWFIGSSGFAFAVSKEFVQGLIDIDAIRAAISAHRIRIGFSTPWGSVNLVTYALRFSQGPNLVFRAGAIDISGRLEVETSTGWAPNGWVTFKQAVTLAMDATTQSVSLMAVGEPEVDESWFIPHGTVVNIVKVELDKQLSPSTDPQRPSSADQVKTEFSDARTKLVNGLHSFDASASARYTTLDITPDGIIVHGEIGGGSRSAPVVHIGETDQNQAFTALESWIPGGRIERLIWSWVEFPGPIASIWSGVTKTLTDEHRFILPKPAGIFNASQVCLRIEGTQTLANGEVRPAVAGTTCRAPEPDVLMDVPSWWEPVTVPIWLPGLANGVIARDAIAAHVTVQSNTPRNQELTRNTLVYFVDWNSDAPLAVVADALARVRRKNYALGVIAVLPAGAFDRRREELERRLESARARIPAQLLLTEDDEGGWTRTFAPAKVPSIYLINARREFVWQHAGDPEPGDLAAALDQHLVPAPAPQSRALALTVSPGERAPDAFFKDGSDEYALHRLRGRKVLLNFWQAWSAPCLKELRRVQALHQAASGGREPAGEAPFVVAFHGGKDAKSLDKIRKELGLSFVLVHDSEQRIARTYGVRCWPTTISINPDGNVDHIQFGMSRDRRTEVGAKAT